MIRRQAMKNASTERKLKGNYGKNNMIQYPVFLGPMSTPPSPTKAQILQPMPTRNHMAQCLNTNKRAREEEQETLRRKDYAAVEIKTEHDYKHGLMTPPMDSSLDLTSYESSNAPDLFEVTTPTHSDKDYHFLEPSFLESPVSDTTDLSDRTEMMATLDRHMLSIPSLIKATTSLLQNSISLEAHSHDYLLLRAHQSRSFLSSWYRRWRNSLFCPGTSNNDTVSREEYNTRLSVLGTYLSCVIIENRIVTALDPSHGYEYELETQEVATRILDMYRLVSEEGKGEAFMTSTLCIARSALSSAGSWCTNDNVESEFGYDPFVKTESA
jgi:hypothetical protein